MNLKDAEVDIYDMIEEGWVNPSITCKDCIKNLLEYHAHSRKERYHIINILTGDEIYGSTAIGNIAAYIASHPVGKDGTKKHLMDELTEHTFKEALFRTNMEAGQC